MSDNEPTSEVDIVKNYSLTRENPQDLAPDVDDIYAESDWEAVSGWLNIPLDKDSGNVFGQISKFFQDQTIASGEEKVTYTDSNYREHEIVVPTADVDTPREPQSLIPTVGWRLFHYSLPDGTENVIISADRSNFTTKADLKQTRPARVDLTKRPGSQFFRLRPQTISTNDTTYVCQGSWAFNPSDLGRLFQDAEKEGSTDMKAFHVYNRHAELPDGTKALPESSSDEEF